MKSNNKWRIGLATLVFGAALLISFVAVPTIKAADEPIHLVTDWSHRHVVFSPPQSLMDRIRLSRDPRYIQQILRHNFERENQGVLWPWRHGHEHRDRLHGDWSIDMGTGATVGADNFPAKFSFNANTASCSDFVVYNTSLAGSSTQATVVAFDNLYVGTCGVAPSTYWAFNTGGTAVTSVVLSYDGSQVAFVQNNSAATHATLVILKWAANSGTIAAPDTLTAVTPSLYAGCTAPCMTTLQFAADSTTFPTSVDTIASPFYDYNSDTLYAGDSEGYLHQFTSVFHGTAAVPPAETISSTTIIWPCVVSSAYPLSSPVYDHVGGNIYIPSTFGTLKQLSAAVGCGGAGVTKTAQVSTPNDPLDGVLVDSTKGLIYMVVSASYVTATGDTAVYTFPVNFIGGTVGTETILSNDGPGTSIYSGAFDNQWFLGNAGHMYVCGPAAGASNNIPTLYQIAVSTSGVLGTVSTGPALASSTTGPPLCSPVTEFFNSSETGSGVDSAGTDWIFLSVTNLGQTASPVSCAANTGCLVSFDVTSGVMSSSTVTAATRNEAGGMSGIIVDGSSASTGASQVYFTPLTSMVCGTSGTGGCAIQASQSGLN